jgi:hypothetical protein
MQGARRAAVRALQAIGNTAVRPIRRPKFEIGFVPSLKHTVLIFMPFLEIPHG